MQLIEQIQKADHKTNQELPYPYSLDVVALYTSVPAYEAIDVAVDSLPTFSGPLNKVDIKELLTVLLAQHLFSLRYSNLPSDRRPPNGLQPLRYAIAILFMNRLERGVLDLHHIPIPYDRYVDDIYSQAPDEKEADSFHEAMNSAHPRISFEIEKPTVSANGKSLTLLDFTVTIKPNGSTEFEYYQKKAKKTIFVHYKSSLPSKTKRINIVHNEIKRITERCSNPSSRDKHINEFMKTLSLNGYPRSFIQSITSETAQQQQQQQQHVSATRNHNEWLYLRVPYVSDAIDRKLTRVFKNEGFPVRIVHKSTSLRQVLRKKEDKQPNCSRLNRKTSLQKICFRKNVVYKIICNRCQNRYIGSTIRHLHDRIKEHMTQSTSSVFSHLRACQQDNIDIFNVTVEIITTENDPAVNLRLYKRGHAYPQRKTTD